jgi:hypothetical protein
VQLVHNVYGDALSLLVNFLILFGVLFQYNFFQKTPYIVMFVFLFTFGMSVQSIGYFICCVCVRTRGWGETVSYGFILLAIVMEMFLTSPMLIKYLRQGGGDNTYATFLHQIFSLYPAFHYSKIYNDIAEVSNKHFSIAHGQWVEGPGYTIDDLFKIRREKFIGLDGFFEMPTTFQSILYLSATRCSHSCCSRGTATTCFQM